MTNTQAAGKRAKNFSSPTHQNARFAVSQILLEFMNPLLKTHGCRKPCYHVCSCFYSGRNLGCDFVHREPFFFSPCKGFDPPCRCKRSKYSHLFFWGVEKSHDSTTRVHGCTAWCLTELRSLPSFPLLCLWMLESEKKMYEKYGKVQRCECQWTMVVSTHLNLYQKAKEEFLS